MNLLVPLAVAVPLFGAALVAGLGRALDSRATNALAIAVAAGTCGICTALLVHTGSGPFVTWFAGWKVHDHVALGIDFAVAPIGAGFAAFSSLLVTVALAYSWSLYRSQEVSRLFYALMLVFSGGMVGFCLTGDLFDLFVFFEVMSVAAYALTTYDIGQRTVLEGGLQFAVTNSVGAFMILFGIALVYGRTGALNLAQIGVALAHHRADPLVGVALALILTGFLVKAGSAPFHFWLSDAYAVAPIAVGVVLTGVMSDLGYYGIGLVYWTAFSGAGHPEALRAVLAGLAAASALVGGAMALVQDQLTRLVAFATVANGGITLAGIAMLDPAGQAGAAVLVVAGGAIRAALVLLAGVCIVRYGSGYGTALHGRGRRRSEAAVALGFVACALGIAGLPPFGVFLGASLVGGAAAARGFAWLEAVLSIGGALTAAAILQSAGRIFLGLGARADPVLATSEQDQARSERRDLGGPPRLAVSLAPVYGLLALGLGLSFVPGVRARVDAAARLATDRPAYAALVLAGAHRPLPAAAGQTPSPAELAAGAGASGGAVAIAALLLGRRRLPGRLRRAGRLAGAPVRLLHRSHSGALGDYLTWLVVGAAAISLVLAIRPP